MHFLFFLMKRCLFHFSWQKDLSFGPHRSCQCSLSCCEMCLEEAVNSVKAENLRNVHMCVVRFLEQNHGFMVLSRVNNLKTSILFDGFIFYSKAF